VGALAYISFPTGIYVCIGLSTFLVKQFSPQPMTKIFRKHISYIVLVHVIKII